jgi:AcrR family transcriptional regulator
MSKSEKSEIREKVVNVAKDMLVRFGLRGLNMVELARECGLAKATLYKIIGSKEDLIREIASEIFEVNIIKMLEPYKVIEDPVRATNEFIDNYLDYAIAGQRILVQQIYKEYPLIEKYLEDRYSDEIRLVNRKYLEWQEEGIIHKSVNVKFCIDALQDLNDFYVKSSYSEEEIIERLRTSFRCMFRGMGVPLE